MKYLLDTMVVSEPTKRKKDSKVMHWLIAHDPDCAISILTLGEVERGIVDMAPSKRRSVLVAWFNSFANEMERRERILPVDRALMSFWGPIYSSEERLTKRKPPFVDTLLAATAEMHGLTMVTRNEKDFPKSLKAINPWKI
jgi:toxin FitB